MLRRIFKCLAGAAYAGGMAYAVGNWAICDAYIRRGYEAVGGEYFLFPAVFIVAYKAIQLSFKVLEDWPECSPKGMGRMEKRQRHIWVWKRWPSEKDVELRELIEKKSGKGVWQE